MSQRQETQLSFASEQDIERTGIRHIASQIVSRQHYSFTEAGRTGSIIQQDYFIIVQISVSDIFTGEPIRIFFRKPAIEFFQELLNILSVTLMQTSEVRQWEYASDFTDFLFFQSIPNPVTHKQKDRFGMIDDMMHIIRIEIG